MLNGAKVLVAGGTGFIGANLVLRLLAEGCQVRSTLHRRPAVVQNQDVEYVEADLTVMEDCRQVVEGMDYVFMCAANTSGAAVITATPLVHVTPNVVMCAQLMQASYDVKVKKYLFISSSAAYPPISDRPVREEDILDGDPFDAYYPVGWMKRYVEILCQMYARRIEPPMPTIVIRPSNAYGPYDDYDFRTSHMTAALIRRVIERHQPVEVWGTGDDVRDLIYIDDLVEGMVSVFEKTVTHSAVNIASGQAYTVKRVLQTILDTDGYQGAQVRFDPSKPATIPVLLIDAELAREEFGFQAKISLQEGIKKTVDWYRKCHVQ